MKRSQLLIKALFTFLVAVPLPSLAELRLDVIDSMDFGTLSIENGTCTLKNNGSLVGTNGQTCLGSGTAAKFTAVGEPNSGIVISAFQSAESHGITLVPELITSSSKTLNGKGIATIKVAGSLVFNQASSGSLFLNYTLSINYE